MKKKKELNSLFIHQHNSIHYYNYNLYGWLSINLNDKQTPPLNIISGSFNTTLDNESCKLYIYSQKWTDKDLTREEKYI